MKKIPTVIILMITLISCNKVYHPVYIEAESFKDKGGWVVDPQFVEQVGSPYLLAHGMGDAVKNASTEVNFEALGEYHVWVRTKNWAPGNWEAPGRFKIIVNGQELETVLGTEEGWNWQYAGTTVIDKRKVVLELKDLSGFDGRCDALYFSMEDKSPPSDMDKLMMWKSEVLNSDNIPEESKDFDLVIVGGGIAGCAAAITAAEQGLNVALIHDRPVLGGNASGEIRVHTLGITWYYDRILSMINTGHYPNGSPEALADDEKRTRNIMKYNNIHLYLNWRAYTSNTEGEKISSVDARHTITGKQMRFSAPLFVDCTGDGWIGYWAGAEYMYGREDSTLYHEGWAEHGDLWSPGTPDNRIMGSSVLWRSYEAEEEYVFPEVPWAMEVAKNHSEINGEWYWEFSRNDLSQIEDGEEIRDHLLKAIYGSFFNAKKDTANAKRKLEWVSYLLGKRESRRLTGDYIYNFSDVREKREFNDSVVKEKRDVDVHYQMVLVDSLMPDFYSNALFYDDMEHYYIPYRCLYSKNISNLFMAGRCFSCSHIGLGGPRVMNTTGQMGAAVGYAASLCIENNTNPRGIYQKHLDELMELIINCSKEE